MPLYDYKCLNCGGIHEVLERHDAPLVHSCPICEGAAARMPSVCSFTMPGFKNGQDVSEDD